jgi:hypothetical protein
MTIDVRTEGLVANYEATLGSKHGATAEETKA